MHEKGDWFYRSPFLLTKKLRIKADWTGGDGRVNGSVPQLRRVQKRDGYAYQIVKSEIDEPIQTDTYVQAEFQFA